MAKRRRQPTVERRDKKQKAEEGAPPRPGTLRAPPASPSFNTAAPPGLKLPGVSRVISGPEFDDSHLNKNDNQHQRTVFAFVRIVVVGDLDLKEQEVRRRLLSKSIASSARALPHTTKATPTCSHPPPTHPPPLSPHQFTARFDLTVSWVEDQSGTGDAAIERAERCVSAHRVDLDPESMHNSMGLDFEPVLRFPTAVHWEQRGTKVFIVDKEHHRVGFRTTIEGRFKSQMSLRSFPFDVQALKISVMFGVEASTGDQLFEHHARFEQDPFHANLILYQIDSEYGESGGRGERVVGKRPTDSHPPTHLTLPFL